MADTDTKAIADFYAGLSSEDATECARDVLAWGQAYTKIDPDGTRKRVPPSEWATELGLPGPMLVKVSRDELLKMYGEDDG